LIIREALFFYKIAHNLSSARIWPLLAHNVPASIPVDDDSPGAPQHGTIGHGTIGHGAIESQSE
tara:strand:- start:244 stop:435 length:192 start_codon:yes stop_codon:yes gene_type:complete